MQPTRKADTILVVEDEPEVRSYLELSLRCHGYTVRNTEDGEEALQFLNRRGDDVSLVLMDVSLRATQWEGKPIDGIELARLLKQSRTTAK